MLAPLAVGFTGVVIERTMLSRLYKLDHLYGLLLTFGLALVFQGIFTSDAMRRVWSDETRTSKYIANAVPGGIGGTGGTGDTLITQTAPDVTNGDVANPVITPTISPAPVPSDTLPAVDPSTVLPAAPVAPANVVQDTGTAPSPDVAL